MLQLGAKLLSALVLRRQTSKIWLITGQLCVCHISLRASFVCVCTVSPAVIVFKDNCSVQKDSNCLCASISQNSSAIISSLHLLFGWRHTFSVLVIIVRLRSTCMCMRNSSFFFSNAHGSTLHVRDEDEHGDGPAVWHWSFHFVSEVHAKATNVVCYWFPSFKPGWVSLRCCIVFREVRCAKWPPPPSCISSLLKWHCRARSYQ